MMAMLVIAYTLNFIDRQIVGILAEPIKADLGLSDGQLGWMGGTAFALFYTVLAIPLAMLADRRNRSWIIALGLTLWSAATALCGLAQNFWQLFLARMSVGVGEAAGVAPAYSLISDLYPPERRARALAIFSLGIPIGSALGVLFGGLIAASVDWRAAFVTIGLVGVLFAPIFKYVVRDPGHGHMSAPPSAPAAAPAPEPAPEPAARPTSSAPSIGTVFRTIAAKPSFWYLSLGAGMASMAGYGFAFWIPSFLARSFDLGLVDRSWVMAGIAFFGGATGIWAGGVLGDRLGSRAPGGYARLIAIAFLVTLPSYLVAFASETLWLSFLLFLIPSALGLMWLGPVVTAITKLVPANMRATASALFLFINNLLGLGLGSPLIGEISDALTPLYGEEALRYSAMATTLVYAGAAIMMALAARRLGRDVVEA
ncbi:spinster family MFS transporter [Sphingomicrobium astaxanthinifaciens]|uniref:spinster family MFS transporter n=1 Tax=Sphingomicrobium astaxanthinifaciens TaxID=1227949 RepID=UPI001FCB3549|nr:MFS transporter [Sphingomicrobium astaxanthinifaciens]MCJ7421124.1 MFS transporter [Sphingomicrobium astaxanthinifaciens]